MKRLLPLLLALLTVSPLPAGDDADARSIRGIMLCGYQGWFRCPGDRADAGWSHWSRDSGRLAPETLTFEMWPDMTEYPPEERFAVHQDPGNACPMVPAA